ncbi:MAG TPA: KamA family radical SAM protein [Nitrospiria bacterium]|jgi:lysine 2,3-aminomutase
MEQWVKDLRASVVKAEDLERHLGVPSEEVQKVIQEYPMRITPHVLNLIKEKGDPIWNQVVPQSAEMENTSHCIDDPLHEEKDSPVPHLVHRYPDRVLFMVTNQCPIYCRFCTRKRLVGKPGFVSKGDLMKVVEYISNHPEIRDIILSGGDPLLIPDGHLETILKALRGIPTLEIIRIGSRVPGSLPSRITDKLCDMLKKYHPLYMNLHFNHPDEITPEVKQACEKLANIGIPLGSQTVLLKGVNDDPDVMKQLMQKLLAIRVKPYYLYQTDLVNGTEHFRESVEKGLEIIQAIQGHTSGMAVPHFVIDAPGGGGKIPILPSDNLLSINSREVILKNYENKVYQYPQPKHVEIPIEEEVSRD